MIDSKFCYVFDIFTDTLVSAINYFCNKNYSWSLATLVFVLFPFLPIFINHIGKKIREIKKGKTIGKRHRSKPLNTSAGNLKLVEYISCMMWQVAYVTCAVWGLCDVAEGAATVSPSRVTIIIISGQLPTVRTDIAAITDSSQKCWLTRRPAPEMLLLRVCESWLEIGQTFLLDQPVVHRGKVTVFGHRSIVIACISVEFLSGLKRELFFCHIGFPDQEFGRHLSHKS